MPFRIYESEKAKGRDELRLRASGEIRQDTPVNPIGESLLLSVLDKIFERRKRNIRRDCAARSRIFLISICHMRSSYPTRVLRWFLPYAAFGRQGWNR